MQIKNIEFIASCVELNKCPKTDLWEFAFIGRSNVGKSSLINMLCGIKTMAKTSSTPGKTQCINHFLVNKNHYWVDLPGYGYARVSQKSREKWSKMTENYLCKRKNLALVFVLIDSRISPQAIDLEFINFLGENSIPFAIIATKIDKVSEKIYRENLKCLKSRLLEYWEDLPPIFLSSSKTSKGKDDILNYIDSCIFELDKV